MKRNLFALLPLLVLAAVACKSGEFETSETGLQYKIHSEGDGPQAKIGDIIKFHVIQKTANDSELFNSFKQGQPQIMRVEAPKFKGDLVEGIAMLKQGDSASFLISGDSIQRVYGMQMPASMKAGDFYRMDIKVLEVKSEEAYRKQMMEDQLKAQQQFEEQRKKDKETIPTDIPKIEQYAKEKGLKIQKLPSGLFYVIEKQGSGAKAKDGDLVSVHYRGYTMDGTVFDESFKRGEPIEFPLGQGQVIEGWDEGLKQFNKGAKGKLLIPAGLAYGSADKPGIPANSILIFDVEMVDIKDQPAQPQLQMPE